VSKGVASAEIVDAAFSVSFVELGSPVTPPGVPDFQPPPHQFVDRRPTEVSHSPFIDVGQGAEENVDPVEIGAATEIAPPPIMADVSLTLSGRLRRSIGSLLADRRRRLIAAETALAVVGVIVAIAAHGSAGDVPATAAQATLANAASPPSAPPPSSEAAERSDVPGKTSDVPGKTSDVPGKMSDVPGKTSDVPRTMSEAKAEQGPAVEPSQRLPKAAESRESLEAGAKPDVRHATERPRGIVRAAIDKPKPVDKPPLSSSAPVSAETLFKQGVQAFVNGDAQAALGLLQRAKVANPSYAPTWRVLGQVNEKLGDRAAAKSAFQRYLALTPNAPDAGPIRDRMESL
jgi:hypothetical protein